MSKYIIAHDFGTTGNKSTLYDEEGNLLHSGFSGYKTIYPHVNWAEQNPYDWWDAICVSTKDLLQKSKINKSDVAVISFSAQMMGCLPLNKKGEPLRNSIIWADQRSVGQALKLEQELGEEKIYNITGHKISPTYSLEKIMWLMDNEPDIYKNTFKFVHAKDYIVSRLTGKFVTDYSDASGMNLFDIIKKKWSPEILKVSKLDPAKLPEPHCSFDVIGGVSASVADEIGLKAGTPVVIGTGDGTAASVGAGVVSEGNAYNYIGSSSWIAMATKKPILDPKRETFNWVHVDPNMYMPCGTMQTAGASYEWLKDNICLIEQKAAEDLDISPFELMDISVENSVPTSNKLIFLPYLMGERSPHWNPNARGAFIGLSLKHKRKDIIRSVMEGVTYNLKMISEIFENVIDFSDIRVIGGAGSPIWRKIMADIYNKNVLKPKILEEATSLGAAIVGGVGVGIFESIEVAEKLNPITEIQKPDPENVKKYESIYPIFKESYKSLVEIYDKLSSL
jgi:xylulokinase